MKIYAILDYISRNSMTGIYSLYLSKEKAYSVSDELKAKEYEKEIQDLMDKEQMTKDEATDWVNIHFFNWLYKVVEFEVEE